MKLKLGIIVGIVMLLSACNNINNTPYEPVIEEGINYTVLEEVTYSGEIVSIDGANIELDDGTIIHVSKNSIISSNFVTMVVTKGPTEYEFYIKEVTAQASLLANPGTNTLEVVLIDGEATVSGNVTVMGGNILQILDKRFILTEDTLFNTEINEEDPLLDNMLLAFEVGDFIGGYGFMDANDEYISGTIIEFLVS